MTPQNESWTEIGLKTYRLCGICYKSLSPCTQVYFKPGIDKTSSFLCQDCYGELKPLTSTPKSSKDHLVEGDHTQVMLPSKYLDSLREECKKTFPADLELRESAQEALELSLCNDWEIVEKSCTKLWITQAKNNPEAIILWPLKPHSTSTEMAGKAITSKAFSGLFKLPLPLKNETLCLEIRPALEAIKIKKELIPSNQEIQAALDHAYQIKWHDIAFGSGIDKGSDNCELCKIFYTKLKTEVCQKNSITCPVNTKTGSDCSGAYLDWHRHHVRVHSTYRSRKRQPNCPECDSLSIAVYRFQLDLAFEFRTTNKITPLGEIK